MLASIWRALRRHVLTPSISETKLSTRGFHVKSPEAREILETVGVHFLTGYGYAAQARRPADAVPLLDKLPVRFRGFAYEGASMGFAVRDGLPFGSSRNISQWLAGEGGTHIYMAYIGVGWAMARVPRFRWPAMHAPDRLLRWLVLDGYGFHQAYFHTGKYVHQHYQEPSFPWPVDGPQQYAARAIDQGIGRAMWFVGGTDPAIVAAMIDKFPESRHSDLYSGAGLAAAYAGGADEGELRAFWDRAGSHRPILAQGAAFAATTRVQTGLLVPHTEMATRIFCGVTPAEATRICDGTRPARPESSGEEPAYEVWRQQIANEFVSLGRTSR
jgi:hypothetical protein